MLLIGFVPLVPAPTIDTMSVVVNKTSITVSLSTSAEGTVYCGVMDPRLSPPSSVETIQLQNYRSATSGGTTDVVINGLTPVTKYDVYCYTMKSGSVMSVSRMLSTHQSIETLCCKSLVVNIRSPNVFVNDEVQDAVTLAVDSAPTGSISVVTSSRFRVTSTGVSGDRTDSFVPASTTFMNASYGVKSLAFTALSTPGTDTLVIEITGDSASEFALEYVNSVESISVVASSTALPPPGFLGASFGGTGTTIVATFDSATDRAGKGVVAFPCSYLFAFPGYASSVCQWVDSSNVLVTLDAFDVRENLLRAACVNGVDCSGWNASVTSSVNVEPPADPVLPTVLITAPSIINSCSGFTLDLTNSIGASGREWTYSVTVVHSGGNNSVINAFLASSYHMSPPTPIPESYFEAGTTYTFTVRLENFLGAVGFGTSNLLVYSSPVPDVYILGSPSRTITRSMPLSLQASASIDIGCNGVSTSNNLLFTWVISSDGVPLPEVQQSTSSQASLFRLDGYTLATNTLYTIELSVTHSSVDIVALAKASVLVSPSTIVAIISGDIHASADSVVEMTLSFGQSLALNGSLSYDNDIPSLYGLSAGLSLDWSCTQVSPSVTSGCPLSEQLSNGNQMYSVNAIAADVTAEITLQVTSGTRSSTAVVRIQTVDVSTPSISISTSFDSVKTINAFEVFVLEASVTLEAFPSASAVWYMNDVIVDSTVALTKVNQTLTRTNASEASQKFPMNLVLSSNTLAAGSTTLFRLQCNDGFSSLTVYTNTPPASGLLAVDPESGIEISTVFSFSSSNWFDEDTPLTYEFSFYSNSNIKQVFHSRSELSYATPSSGQ